MRKRAPGHKKQVKQHNKKVNRMTTSEAKAKLAELIEKKQANSKYGKEIAAVHELDI